MRTIQKQVFYGIAGFLGACALCFLCASYILHANKRMDTRTSVVSFDQSTPVESTPAQSTPGQSTLGCRRLPAFDRSNWEAIHSAFASASPIAFGQFWRIRPEPRFLPGQVRIGFYNENLWIYAEMEDEDIFNPSRTLNEFAYERGDVFEIFLRPSGGESYIEFHVTPENQKLPLWFPRAKRTRRDAGWKWRYLEQSAFSSQTQRLPNEKRWQVLVAIPFATLGLSTPTAGDEWLFSFGRYDYTRGQERPVISSTSPHRYPDFHRLHEWRRFVFEEETASLQASGSLNDKKES